MSRALRMFANMLAAPVGGAPSVDTPDVILGSDLVAWYKRGTGIYDALIGGSLVSSDGTEVGRWEDQSGNGYHLVRNGTLAFGHMQWRPGTTYLSAGTVQFSIANVVEMIIPDAMGSVLSVAGQGEMWVSFQLARTGGGDGSWNMSASDNGSLMEWSDNHCYEGWGTTTRKDTGVPSIQATIASAFHRYDVYSASGDWQNYFDTVSQFSTGTNTVTFRTTSSLWYLGAHVSEIVFSKAKASAGQRADMDTYLST